MDKAATICFQEKFWGATKKKNKTKQIEIKFFDMAKHVNSVK